ncbi:MAG: hypothetical protein P1T08_12815 [Acidimicrobiia bacterium]|nr:hypothetical protein [Acidimicrobiia bacterium]
MLLKGTGGAVFEFDEPLPDHIAEQLAKGQLIPVDSDGNPIVMIGATVVEKAKSVKDILEEVGDDLNLATAALETEQATENPRKSLIEGLGKVIADASGDD